MREIDPDSLAILTGSRSGDRLIAYVWYDGELAWPVPLTVGAWKCAWDDSAQIKGSIQLDIVDNSGQLSPWLHDDPLGVGGSQIQLLYQVGGGGGLVNIGWFRITKNAPQDEWRLYVIKERGYTEPDSGLDPGTRVVSVPMGSVIPIDGEDLTVNVKNDRLIAPESPRTPTVISEIERLTRDILPVTVLAGVVDEPISTSVIFERERMDAVEDLVSRLDAGWRMNGNGEFEIYPLGEQTPVWQIVGGPEGALVRVRREQSLDGLENLFVSDGTRKTKNSKGEDVELPVRGIARIESGPLRDGGPHGRFTTFRSSPLITSEAMAKKDAQTFRDNHVRTQTINLQVTCLPNPAIETGDYVTVAHPVVDGRRVPLLGKVVKMEISGSDDSVNEMSLTVTCDAADVYEVMGGVDRGEPPIPD